MCAKSFSNGHEIEFNKDWRYVDNGELDNDARPCKKCGKKPVIMMVPIPAFLSGTGRFRWAKKPVDGCIAQIVKALNDAGIYTSGCCCGHGRMRCSIGLHDGRFLIITEPSPTMELLHKLIELEENVQTIEE